MDLRKIKKLIELVEESGISELEVTNGDESVRIRRPLQAEPVAPAVVSGPAPSESPNPDRASASQGSGTSAAPRVMHAPIAGTFYRAPAPDAAPFVTPGQRVQLGDVLCIIESMKMMNQIEAELAGEVVAVLVDNGEPVETGTPLFQIL